MVAAIEARSPGRFPPPRPAATAPRVRALSNAQRLRSIAGGAVGNLVEWYDWFVYSAFALYFAPIFFPAGDATAQLLNSAAVFAVGFVFRPLGAFLLGHYADKHGRKAALLLSILMMCAGSLMVALTPGAASIGTAAPVLLVLARLLQGLSVGGEYGASTAYLAEMAKPGRRGFWTSFMYVTLIGGQLLALVVLVVLQAVLSEAELEAWGWRVPFALGALFALVGLWLRRDIDETPAFEKVPAAKHRHLYRQLAAHPMAILGAIGLTIGGTVPFYAFTAYMQKYLVNTAGWAKDEATLVSAVALAIFAAAQPLYGALSDRIGRWPMLVAFGIGGVLATAPLIGALGMATGFWEALVLLLVAFAILSFTTAVAPLVKATLFPVEVRALGLSVTHSVAVAAFGGTVEFVALWLKSVGREGAFAWYVAATCGLTLAVAIVQRRRIRSADIEGDA